MNIYLKVFLGIIVGAVLTLPLLPSSNSEQFGGGTRTPVFRVASSTDVFNQTIPENTIVFDVNAGTFHRLTESGTSTQSLSNTSNVAISTGGSASSTIIKIDGVQESTDVPTIDFNSAAFNITETPTDEFNLLGLASASIASSTLNVGNWTNGYLLQASTSATGGFDWVSTTTLGLDFHDPVTLAGTPDYITISGQEITRNSIDLATDVTGTLPLANGGTGATSLSGGSVIFSNGSILTQDNTNLFWDDSNNRLGIAEPSPAATLTVGSGDAFQVTNLGVVASGTWNGNPVDVSDYTNLAVTSPITLTDDTVGFDFSATAGIPYYPTFTHATSTAWTGTTTIALGTAYNAQTWSGVQCFTDAGTLHVRFTDGTNAMNDLQASTTVGTVTLSTNNTFTAGEKRYVELGTPASSPTEISCTVNYDDD